MASNNVRIVDIGRGAQIEGHRLTVMDVFYYLHRGYDFDFIQRALPTLGRDEFDAVVEYVSQHRAELIEQEQLVEARNKRGIAEQKAKGLYREIDESVPCEIRAERLKDKLRQRLKEQAEKNGGQPAC